MSDSNELRFKWVGCQLIWDSSGLDVKWCEVQVMWLSTDVWFKWFCQTKLFCETSFKNEALKIINIQETGFVWGKTIRATRSSWMQAIGNGGEQGREAPLWTDRREARCLGPSPSPKPRPCPPFLEVQLATETFGMAFWRDPHREIFDFRLRPAGRRPVFTTTLRGASISLQCWSRWGVFVPTPCAWTKANTQSPARPWWCSNVPWWMGSYHPLTTGRERSERTWRIGNLFLIQ